MMAMKPEVDMELVRSRLETSYTTLDIVNLIETHGLIRLRGCGKQVNGSCPFGDCPVDTDGFIVWPQLSDRGRHFHCRGCKRSGDIVKFIMDLKGLRFLDACKVLGIPNPYSDNGHYQPAIQKKPLLIPKANQELALLQSLSARMQSALQRERARAYIDSRGLPFGLCVEQGLGYIPALSLGNMTSELERLRGWYDHIIFPLQTSSGHTCYAGRSLFLWIPGMNEDEHKCVLDAYNEQAKVEGKPIVPRWKYITGVRGCFNWQVVTKVRRLVLVEGPFDVLALQAVGIMNAVAIGTTGIDAKLLPLAIEDVMMALDVDGAGQQAAKRLTKELRRKGLDVQICPPVGGKDWSAVYRLYGKAGFENLLQVVNSVETPDELVPLAQQEESEPLLCSVCGLNADDAPLELIFQYTDDGTPYCSEACQTTKAAQPTALETEQPTAINPADNRVVRDIMLIFDAALQISSVEPSTQDVAKPLSTRVMCSWHPFRAACHCDVSGNYCAQCRQERQFHIGLIHEYGAKNGYPSFATMSGSCIEGRESYEQFCTTASELAVENASTLMRRSHDFVC